MRVIKNSNYSAAVLAFLSFFILFITACEEELEVGPTVTITSVDPGAAFLGDQVTLQGDNLNTVQNLFVGDKGAEIVSRNQTSLTFTVPTNAAPGPNVLTLAMLNNYRVTAELEVMTRPIPSIFGLSTNAAAPGEEVTIAGMNLDMLTSVTFGGIEANVVSATNAELVVVVPDGPPLNTAAVIELMTSEITETYADTFFVGTNYAANGGLDAGSGDDFAGWEKLNGGAGLTSVSGEDAYFGRAVRVVGAANPDQPWRTQFATALTPLNFGSEYTMMMWVKGEAPGAQMRISASRFDGNGADYFYGETKEIPTEWTQISWTFEVTNDLPEHSVVLDMGFTDIPFVIDNIVLVETGAAGPAAPGNALADGGFEGTLGENWVVNNGTIALTSDAANVHCGNQALMVTPANNPDQPWQTQLASENLDLEVGEEYIVSIWAKATAPDVQMRISASLYNGGDGSDYFYGDAQTFTEEWAEYTWVYTVQAPPSGAQHLVLDMGYSAAVFYLDDISVRKNVELPRDNKIGDGSFENGIEGESATWEVLNGTFALNTDAGDVYDGNNSLMVTGAGNPDQAWRTQIATTPLDLVAGTTYGVTIWAKATADDVPISVSASRYNGGDGSDYFYGDPQTITQEWAAYTWTFEAQDPPSGAQHLVLDLGRSDAVFFLDNIELYPIAAFTCP